MCVSINENERSWAIDLISEINIFLHNKNLDIKRASGEQSVRANRKRMFPDVILHGTSGLLMGWELKMPDTNITDRKFISNAEEKAKLIKLNSFLLWNAREAVLYVLNDNDEFIPLPGGSWDTSNRGLITNRDSVFQNPNIWKDNVRKIILDLNNFLGSGSITTKPLIESFKTTQIIDFILRENDNNANYIQNFCIGDTRLNAKIDCWWDTASSEHQEDDKFKVLSKSTIISWINKILFAHVLAPSRNEARDAISQITEDSSPSEVTQIFNEISQTCDFFNIFCENLCSNIIAQSTWDNLLELNSLLKEIEISAIDQTFLQGILESVIYENRRKISGQYATPMFLAKLLCGLTILDKNQTSYDPCCGTGTIVRAMYNLKKEVISSDNAISQIFASDKDPFALQMATLSLVDPNNIGSLLKIFNKDIFKLNLGNIIPLLDPNDGSVVELEMESVKNIVSNLPFIRFETKNELNNDINREINTFIRSEIGENVKLDGKSDLSAYIPFKLWQLLDDSGRCGIIMSNSWLATEWGQKFRNLLVRFFKIEYIVASFGYKWFRNADIVTTILVLEKRSEVVEEIGHNEVTKFITISTDLENNGDLNRVNTAISHILADSCGEFVNIKTYNTQTLYNNTFGWNLYFSGISWIDEAAGILSNASNFLNISRGERRGWNNLFYVKESVLKNLEIPIENQFLRPALRSSREINTLLVESNTNTKAFVYTQSIEELEDNGYIGALAWIRRFENERNGRGVPLPEVLAMPNLNWYSMDEGSLADFVTSVNINKRFFISKMQEPSVIDQRLIKLSVINETLDKELLHALLNSIITLFFIEANGFGRGLGALDLSATRMKRTLKIPNPILLDQLQVQNIKEHFNPLICRDIQNLEIELEDPQRIEFDMAVLSAYGLGHLYDEIKESLLFLYNMRVNRE